MNIIQILEMLRGDIDITGTTVSFFHDGEYYKTSISCKKMTPPL